MPITSHASGSSHELRSNLLLGWLCSAVPGFTQVRNRLSAQRACGDKGKRIAPGLLGCRFGELPDLLERRETIVRRSATTDQGHDLLMETIHARIGMRPRIGECRLIEWSDELLHQGELEQSRAMRDQQPDRVLDGRDIADQIVAENDLQQILVALQRDPGIEGDEGRIEHEARLATERDDVEKVVP